MLDVLLVTLYFLRKVHKQAQELLPWVSRLCRKGGNSCCELRTGQLSLDQGATLLSFENIPILWNLQRPEGRSSGNFHPLWGQEAADFLGQVQLQMLWAQIPKFQKDVYTL